MKRKILNSLLTGVLLIGVGVGYLGNALEFWSGFTIFFEGWWTMFLILPALYGFINGQVNFFNCLLLVGGLALLLPRLLGDRYGDKVWWIALAAALLVLGLYVIIRPFFKHGERKSHNDGSAYFADTTPGEDYDISFSGRKFDYTNREFTGLHVDVSFGSATVDLRHAIINQDCAVNVNVDFSGMKIFLPSNVRFENHCSASFGAVSSDNLLQGPEGSPKIYLTGDCSFGGIEVRN